MTIQIPYTNNCSFHIDFGSNLLFDNYTQMAVQIPFVGGCSLTIMPKDIQGHSAGLQDLRQKGMKVLAHD